LFVRSNGLSTIRVALWFFAEDIDLRFGALGSIVRPDHRQRQRFAGARGAQYADAAAAAPLFARVAVRFSESDQAARKIGEWLG
jgi:hypothetical protein